MTFWDRLDCASDIDFAWDAAMWMLALAGACALVMLVRRAWRWVVEARRKRRISRRVDRLIERLKEEYR